MPLSVSSTLANIRANLDEPDVLLYNVGGGHFAPYDAISGDDHELDFQSNALGLLLTSQQVSSRMAARGRGVIGITGATSSWRSTASSPREALPSRWHASWVQREFTSFTPFCLTSRRLPPSDCARLGAPVVQADRAILATERKHDDAPGTLRRPMELGGAAALRVDF